MSIKQTLVTNLKNIPGAKTKRKLVVIYVDDYGSIRVKTKKRMKICSKRDWQLIRRAMVTIRFVPQRTCRCSLRC